MHAPGSHRRSVSYIDKSRHYYAACGYVQPYRWATNAETPFAFLVKPLADSTVALITTSYPHVGDAGATSAAIDPTHDAADAEYFPLTVKVPYSQAIDPVPERMFTDDLSWDKAATSTDDVASFLPIAQLAAAAETGRVSSVGAHFYGSPTEYSQRRTAADATLIAEWCGADGIDAVILVPL